MVYDLSDLPAAPKGKFGWPWTVECLPRALTVSDSSPWPRISIVTPSYNQGQFLEETIRSVLLQGYANLEYIIIDGGSSDQSIEIIKRYSPFLSAWVIEHDRGQAHAVNKGLARSTGDVFQWINSDDVLRPGALACVGRDIGDFDALAGGITFVRDGKAVHRENNRGLSSLAIIADDAAILQPAIWLRRDKITASGGLNGRYQYAFDLDLIIRYLMIYPNVRYVDFDFVHFRLHEQSKSMSAWGEFRKDGAAIRNELRRHPNRRVRVAADRAMRRTRWHESLSSIRKNKQKSRFHRFFMIALQGLADPYIRINRFSFGAMLSILRDGL